jgi:hypothetical protein
MTIMGRLYSQVWPQTIELLVIRGRMQRMASKSRLAGPGLIDRTATRYQDNESAREAFADEP